MKIENKNKNRKNSTETNIMMIHTRMIISTIKNMIKLIMIIVIMIK